MDKRIRMLVEGAVIAALYAGITVLTQPISYGPIQVRVAEAMTLLPMVTGAAVPGLFIGCLIANLLGAGSIWDIVFGSLATLLAALITQRIKNKWLAALPPVLLNAVVVGLILALTLKLPFWLIALQVGAGQAIACYVLGIPLLKGIEKLPVWVKGKNRKVR